MPDRRRGRIFACRPNARHLPLASTDIPGVKSFKRLIATCCKGIIVLLPWSLRRVVLQKAFGYKLHRDASIGLAWIYPHYLEMGEKSRIDHFTVAINLGSVVLEPHALVGRNNWITGFPLHDESKSEHFAHQPQRSPSLRLGSHAAITKNHHIDCTNEISIGSFSTIAGYYSQFLTHSIDLHGNRQHSAPIAIGSYCFVGSNVVVLAGATLPSFCVLGAKSLLNKAYQEEWTVYGGVPARALAKVPDDALYFRRTTGIVV